MRGTFIKTLTEIARKDARILLLTGDLGYMAVEPFRDEYPQRFINVGVAEQNLVGIATGLAEAGFIPFVYSIGTFASLRPYEFIRNGPILHKLQVRIVGVGGGFEYGLNGITHFALEDIGIMRIQPEIEVIAPADYAQTRRALLNTWDLPGPIYYRIGKDDRSLVRGLDGKFDLGKPQRIRAGEDVLIVATGSISLEAVKAADLLEAEGISSEVVVLASFNSRPATALSVMLAKFPKVFTVEAHYISGGLGSMISEIIAENNICCQLIRCAVTSIPRGLSGSQDFLNDTYNISAKKIAQRIFKELKS